MVGETVWQRISGTAAGTTSLITRKGYFDKVVMTVSKTGTATFYDQNAGSSAANLMFEISNAVAGTAPNTYWVGARVKNGLTIVTGGTTDFVVVYE